MNTSSTTYQRLVNIPLPDKCQEDPSKMHICMLIPPSPFVVPCGWEWTHTAPIEGPSIMATLLKGLGYSFTLIDNRDDRDHHKLNETFKNFDLITIFTTEDSFPYLEQACKIAKKQNPNRPIILGGSLISSEPELVLNNLKADYGVIGEGELTTIELMDFLEQNEFSRPLDQIEGIVWKKDHLVIKNPMRQQIENLDIVPIQDFSVWKRHIGKDIPEIFLSTTRGCHMNCSFCYRTHPKYNKKSPNRVKQEIDYLKKYNFKHAWINDLSFTYEGSRVKKLMKESFSSYKFSWNCFARVTEVDLDVLKSMKKYGCDIILYGFEAINQDILNSYNKGTCRNDMLNAIYTTREANIKVGGLFIIGAPDETLETLKTTISFTKEFKEITRVKYLSVIPGTQLFKEMLSENVIKDPVEHLRVLAEEESIEEDIINIRFPILAKNLKREELRSAYNEINTQIEVRPYEYWTSKNNYLNSPKKFIKRVETKEWL